MIALDFWLGPLKRCTRPLEGPLHQFWANLNKILSFKFWDLCAQHPRCYAQIWCILSLKNLHFWIPRITNSLLTKFQFIWSSFDPPKCQKRLHDGSLERYWSIISKYTFSYLNEIHFIVQKKILPTPLCAQHLVWKWGRKVKILMFFDRLGGQNCSKWYEILWADY